MFRFNLSVSILASVRINISMSLLKRLCRKIKQPSGLCATCLLAHVIVQCSGNTMIEFRIVTEPEIEIRTSGLTMSGKREHISRLLGMRRDQTKQAYDTQNERDVTGAEMANEGAQFGAGLAEKGASRRDANNRFNADMGWDQTKYAIDRADKIAAANAPPSEKEQAELEWFKRDKAMGRLKATEDLMAGSRKRAGEMGITPALQDLYAARDGHDVGIPLDQSMTGGRAVAQYEQALAALAQRPGSFRENLLTGSEFLPFRDFEEIDPASVTVSNSDWWTRFNAPEGRTSTLRYRTKSGGDGQISVNPHEAEVLKLGREWYGE